MPRLLESVSVTAAGALVSYGTGWVVDRPFETGWIPVAAAIVGGLNGLLAGLRGTYAWRTRGGWLAFALDSSWALLGTLLGVVLNVLNSLRPGSELAPEFGVRRNRHVFGRGFALRRSFATTLGNVVTNARLGRAAPIESRRDLIELHEGLHVWQQRWFGPLFPLTYVVVGVVGSIVGIVFGLVSRERRRRGVGFGELVETAAYYDNPFEIWAYRNQGRWETCGARPVLKWGSFRWEETD